MSNLRPLVRAILATLTIVGFFWVIGIVFLGIGDVPQPLEDAAKTLLGILSAALLQILNFYFGDKA